MLFAGQYEDAESGWVYNRFRFYDPAGGVYGSQDPLGVGPNVGTPQGYVHNPLTWADALGLASHQKASKVGIGSNPEIEMGRYGSYGGHHVPAKDVVSGHADEVALKADAPAVEVKDIKAPNSSLEGQELHREITRNQRSEYKEIYKELKESGDPFTWDHVRKAEVNAHTKAGFSLDQAQRMADHGIDFYKGQGVASPTKIPWSGTFDRMKNL